MTVVVVRTGVANVASVLAALKRAGAQPVVSEDADTIARSELAVLPGVGAFGAGMDKLASAGLGEAIAARVQADRPLLAVCLGLQLLCEASDESPGVRGLGLVPGTVRRFGDDVAVPQLGWNRVVPEPGCALVREGHAYFANSYKLAAPPPGFCGALADHGGPFVAALERGSLLACQFHPELSGSWGQELLERWLARGTC